ncbi:winged helix-turn-helix domain-containing protein [Bradyrhizobium sp. ISRA464]|uniref:ATP-binding protein n=1 Tax=Bradyrhizobium sp. ISRA464 TaxID=2866200 RepID=UPI00247B21A2|nr:winged helix-turn-helix domain-containing protein [Bradyrhizobium sp. ISRA464]WGS26836.1 helix-turn-helix transcriptional regulator [Bradyrhizobium sp. ISRA464]
MQSGADDDAEVFEFGPFRLIAAERLLVKKGEPVAVGGRALDILIALIRRAGDVVSHRELVKRAWPDVVVEGSSLRVHVAGLRKALGDGRGGARYITNIPGRGYCFVAPVQSAALSQPSAGASIERVKLQALPPRLQRMIGRDETVGILRSELTLRRFVSIVGPGGVGKTTVAVAVAHAMTTDFHNAVYLIDLSALRNGALIVSTVASAIGCLDRTQDSLPRLLAFLADKKALLVLDSCEHVVEPVATFAESVFRSTPLVHILATTREALRVEGENIYPLPPLDSPSDETTLTAAKALASPAAQLFMDRAAAGGYRQELSDEEAPVIASICRQLDGMPLAIELTASRTSAYGIKGLAQLIGERLMLLWPGRRGVPRHQTLLAMLDWSYDLLSEQEQTVLCTLSVFVGAFSIEMAQAIAFELDRGEFHIEHFITGLVEKSLISISRTEGAWSYRLLDMTRAYAAIKLKRRGTENAVARRHALYFAERLGSIRANISMNRDLTAYSRQIGNIRAALEWSFSTSGDRTVGVALAAGAVPLFLSMSMLIECRRWSLQTIEALNDEDRGTKLELALQLSLAISSTYVHGNSKEVETALQRGLCLAESLGDVDSQLELLAGLNLYRARLADFRGSLAAAERYASLARKFGGPRETVMAEWMLGASYHLVGEQSAAQQSYESGFARAADSGVSEVHSFGYNHYVRALIGYSRTLWDRGLSDRAAQFGHKAIEFAARQGHPVTLCISLLYATQVFLWRGDRQVAEELIERLIAYAATYSLTPYHAGGLGLRGELMFTRGETQRGIDDLRSALSTLRTERQYILSSAFSRALAEALARTGQVTEAATIIDATVADAMRGIGTFELPDILRARAAVLLAASPANSLAAEASLKDSLDCARQQSALGWELRSILALSRLWANQGRVDQARAILSEVYGRFTEGFGTADLIMAKNQLDEFATRPPHS